MSDDIQAKSKGTSRGLNASWLLGEESDEWDRDAFYIQSTNDHDHSAVFNLPRTFRIPQALLNQIAHWVGDPRTAYRSKPDFLRDAIVHRLAYLAETEESLEEFRNANNFIAFNDSVQAEIGLEREMMQTLDLIEKRAKELVLDNRADDLLGMFERAKVATVDKVHQDKWRRMVEDLEDSIEVFIKRRNRSDL